MGQWLLEPGKLFVIAEMFIVSQGDGDDILLRPCRAGFPEDVPVCGLWGKHDVTAWPCEGVLKG